ncbi:hypothetical protein [Bacillus sp. FJAT-27245]|uniref:hypothetical protein n=1 Tax=Bacillus sp. FJAT-27245 TaxID=1684144 RepID=UPI0006A7C02E|nr:hypothetical protein [Bacillus sp. FJAT-27245]
MQTKPYSAIEISKIIDQAIKELWSLEIFSDYCNFSLLKEDSMKNAFYHHLRNKLPNEFLIENNIRIYTEFFMHGIRADLAIVKLDENPGQYKHLQDSVIDILAIVEMKFKNHWNDGPFKEDIEKVKNYIKTSRHPNCQYYLAFIQEAIYEQEEYAWLSQKDLTWAKGHVTELLGYYSDNIEQPIWRIKSYNNLN